MNIVFASLFLGWILWPEIGCSAFVWWCVGPRKVVATAKAAAAVAKQCHSYYCERMKDGDYFCVGANVELLELFLKHFGRYGCNISNA